MRTGYLGRLRTTASSRAQKTFQALRRQPDAPRLGPQTGKEYTRRLERGAWIDAYAATRDVMSQMEAARTRPLSISHYTDAAGALGIVQTHEFWATHAQYLNDPSELVSAEPILADSCASILGDFDKATRVRFESAFWSGYYKSDHYVKGRPEVYVVCFCENPDLLSQWRAYGHLGGGFSLQLDFDALSSDVHHTSSVSLLPVIYDQNEQKRYALRLVRAAVDLIDELQRPREDMFFAQVDSVGAAAGETASRFALQVKSSAFSEEKEWRLVYTRPYEEPYFGFEFDQSLQRCFRTNQRGIIPYVRITTDRSSVRQPWSPRLRKFPVTSITVGPTATEELAQNAMNSLLDDHWYPNSLRRPEVRQSSIPLRA